MRVVLIPILLLFFNCDGQKAKNSGSYYFSPENFLTEKTYSFVNKGDTSEKAQWKMKTVILSRDTVLQTIIIYKGRISEVLSEVIKKGNSKFLLYSLFNDQTLSKCTIIDSAVYKASQKKGEEIKWQIRFKDFKSPDSFSLTKTRSLEFSDHTRQIFMDQMVMENLRSKIKYQYAVRFSYQKGKGLTAYQIIQTDGTSRVFELEAIR